MFLFYVRLLTELCTSSFQMWEKAIELGKQLARMHESHMFDFMELSQLLVRPQRRRKRSDMKTS